MTNRFPDLDFVFINEFLKTIKKILLKKTVNYYLLIQKRKLILLNK